MSPSRLWKVAALPGRAGIVDERRLNTRAPAAMAKTKTELREWISSGFTRVEDVVYVGLGLVLALSAACHRGAFGGTGSHIS